MSLCYICVNANSNSCANCKITMNEIPSNFKIIEMVEVNKYLKELELKRSEGSIPNEQLKSLQDENTYLKSELEKRNTKSCVGDLVDATDYKTEYMKLREQFDNSIKTIKYISSLL